MTLAIMEVKLENIILIERSWREKAQKLII